MCNHLRFFFFFHFCFAGEIRVSHGATLYFVQPWRMLMILLSTQCHIISNKLLLLNVKCMGLLSNLKAFKDCLQDQDYLPVDALYATHYQCLYAFLCVVQIVFAFMIVVLNVALQGPNQFSGMIGGVTPAQSNWALSLSHPIHPWLFHQPSFHYRAKQGFQCLVIVYVKQFLPEKCFVIPHCILLSAEKMCQLDCTVELKLFSNSILSAF